MSERPFVHLHARSEYSLLQASSRIKDLGKRAKQYGFSALGVCDSMALFGALELAKVCGKDLKPLFGMEAVVTSGPRTYRKLQPVYEQYRMLLYARTYKGYENLMKLSSRGHTEGTMQGQARIDEELFSEYCQDLVVIESHAQGLIGQYLRQGKRNEALRALARRKEQVGADYLFLELVNHQLPEELELNSLLIEVARESGVRVVATNDTYYTDSQDAEAHEVLMAIREKTTLSDPRRPRLPNSEYWFKDAEAMYSLFPDNPEACENTAVIAQMCNVKLKYGALYLPDFPLPDDVLKLARLCNEGELPEVVSDELLQLWQEDMGALAESLFPLELQESEPHGESGYRTAIADRRSRPSQPLTQKNLTQMGSLLETWLKALPWAVAPVQEGDDSPLGFLTDYPIYGEVRRQIQACFRQKAREIVPLSIAVRGQKTVLEYSGQEVKGNPEQLPQGLDSALKEVASAHFLRRQCLQRMQNRYGDLPDSVITQIRTLDKDNKLQGNLDRTLDVILKDRLEFELAVIRFMGFSAYFLIVADFINASKDRGIAVGPGRGSAAGSLVAYLTGITDICPLRYGLFFERFLNPERISMPDIDIDFCFRRREESIEYCRQLYGSDRVAHIITFGRLKTKAVLKDVARVLDISFQEANEISRSVPDDPGLKDLEQALEGSAELRRWQDQFPQLFDIARRLEGLARQTGLHAAGVVIAPGPVDDYVPVAGFDEGAATQYDGANLETQGLLKMDFLGLSTLTVIQDTVELVLKNRGIRIDIDKIPLDDPKVYQMLCQAHTAGLFQVDSNLFQGILRDMQPKRFEDIIALVALGRPGPLGSGMVDTYCHGSRDASTVVYPHPMLEELLEETYGVILYQEQVMNCAVILAGYTMAQADQLRRAMGKKKPEEMNLHRQIFVQGALRKGIAEEKSNEIFDLIAKFAEYGFNKSHSACYGLICYQTCWLKANYPQEFMASAMTDKLDSQDQISMLWKDMRRMGIEMIPPSVDCSSLHFDVQGDKILYGLGAVKEVGTRAVELILAARKAGPFSSLMDFCQRVDVGVIGKKAIENLIQVGAMDSIPGSRAQKLSVLDRLIAEGIEQQKARRLGQRSLFQQVESIQISLPEVASSRVEELAWEKQHTGIYFSGHPLQEFQDWMQVCQIPQVQSILQSEHSETMIAGMISGFERRINKEGQDWIRFRVNDMEAGIDCVAFSRQFKKITFKVLDDQVVVASGQKTMDGMQKRLQFQVEDMELLSHVHMSARWKLEVQIVLDENSRSAGSAILAICTANPGQWPLRILVRVKGYLVTLRLPGHLSVSGSPQFISELIQMFGSGSVRVRLDAPKVSRARK